jgi:hypothetical protein
MHLSPSRPYWLTLTMRDAIPATHALAPAEFATIRSNYPIFEPWSLPAPRLLRWDYGILIDLTVPGLSYLRHVLSTDD